MKWRHRNIDPKLVLVHDFGISPFRQSLKIPNTNSRGRIQVKLQGEMAAQTRMELARGITKPRQSFFKEVTQMPSSLAACFCDVFELRRARTCSSLTLPVRLLRPPALRRGTLFPECSTDGTFFECSSGLESSMINSFCAS